MTRRPKNPPHLFRGWPLLRDRLRESEAIVLFVDFDGTLIPIRSDREVKLEPQAGDVLLKLAEDPRITLVAISGRRRAELRRLMGIPGIQYLGLYGAENGRIPILSAAVRKSLREAYGSIQMEVSKYPGVWVENKHASFCVHFRQSRPAVHERVQWTVRARLSPFQKDLHLFENLSDIEIVPQSMKGKGAAVRKILQSRLHRRALPVYFGDDLSDEPAFAAIRSTLCQGIAVQVGEPRRTNAEFNLRNPREVIEALARIQEALP